MIVYLRMVMVEYGLNPNLWIHLESLYQRKFLFLERVSILFFSRDLAIAMHNEECLYHEAQQQQQQQSQGTTNQLPRSPSKQPKKSKNKSRRSSHDEGEKESCNLF